MTNDDLNLLTVISKTVDTLQETNKVLVDKITFLSEVLDAQEKRLEKLENIRKKIAKKEFTDEMKLSEMRQIFKESRPHDRTDIFTDYELVFWWSYLLWQNKRTDKVDNMREMGIRISKLKNLYKFYQEQHPNQTDEFYRNRIKMYLELCANTSQIDNFHQALSDFWISQLSNKIGAWQQVKTIDDTPLGEV
jgi:hypothetical protein